MTLPKFLRSLVLLPTFGLLGGCNAVMLSPIGDIAVRQRDLILASTILMLLIIVPVMIFTAIFAWRYRQSNKSATYDPEFHHSTRLEVLIWSAPLLIIIALGALTWVATHVLDPFRPLERLDAERPINPQVKPLTVEVVSLDWKWLFFYPDLGIATVNELAAPVDTPIRFKITSAAVMNSFWIPAVAGQIYAMTGMETQLNAVANKEGVFEGASANYSGAGFSRMNFKFHSLSRDGFEQWVAKVKGQGSALSRAAYLDLEKPSEQEPVRYYASVDNGLYHAILNMCVDQGKMCADDAAHIDAKGGAGKDSRENREKLIYDGRRLSEGVESPGATFPASGRAPNSNDLQPEGMKSDALTPNVNQQKTQPDEMQGHDMPGMTNQSPAPAQMNGN